MIIESEKTPSVSKIAIVNPYLQGGHVLIAESETAARFVQAGKNLSIDIQVFASTEEVKDFDPDLVVNITYQEGKLTQYPTYVSLNIPVSFLKNVPRFVRNILTCDGFLTVSSSVADWLNQLCAKHNKQPFISHTAFSVPKTKFVTCDFKNALAMYVGTNWDGMRHQDIFRFLGKGDYLKCFGPSKSWKNYPESLYGGEIPFDGVSAFNAYRKHATGLCIGHPEFDSAGVANTRIFEIAAASALPICSDNTLTKNIYNDSVLYLDSNLSTDDLSKQIAAFVQWIRNNSKIAQEMAREAHSYFNQNASMEFYIKNLVEMHARAMRGNGFLRDIIPFLKSTSKEKQKIAYILTINHLKSNTEEILRDIFSQTYTNIDVVVLSKNGFAVRDSLFKNNHFDIKNIHYLSYEGAKNNKQLFDYLKRINAEWISILSPDDRLFKNHTSSMIKTYYENAGMEENIAGLFSACLEHSNDSPLSELMLDEHNIANYNKTRILCAKFLSNVPLATLFLRTHLLEDSWGRISFYKIKSVPLLERLKKKGKILENCSVTCSIRALSKKRF